MKTMLESMVKLVGSLLQITSLECSLAQHAKVKPPLSSGYIDSYSSAVLLAIINICISIKGVSHMKIPTSEISLQNGVAKFVLLVLIAHMKMVLLLNMLISLLVIISEL